MVVAVGVVGVAGDVKRLRALLCGLRFLPCARGFRACTNFTGAAAGFSSAPSPGSSPGSSVILKVGSLGGCSSMASSLSFSGLRGKLWVQGDETM